MARMPTDPEAEDDVAGNAEQREPTQAQGIAEEALHGQPGDEDDAFASTKAHGGLGIAGDDDLLDTVDQMKQMVSSGRIDMGAFEGEPMMDDGDTDISDTDDQALPGDDDIGGDNDEGLDLSEVPDTGDDPLGLVASDHGLEDETADDDIDPDDIDEDDLPGGLVLGEAGYDAMREIDTGDDDDDLMADDDDARD